jgi:hypothetical protein
MSGGIADGPNLNIFQTLHLWQIEAAFSYNNEETMNLLAPQYLSKWYCGELRLLSVAESPHPRHVSRAPLD